MKSSDKCILIDLPKNKFNRYLYPLVYMLNEQGYKPVLRLNAKKIANITYDPYEKLILQKGLLFLGSKAMNFVKKVELNPDYFNALNTENRESIIPMSMHPLIYAENISVFKGEKNINKVIFFAGTTDGIGHSKVQVFDNVISRFKVIDKVKSFDNVFLPKNREHYNEFELELEQPKFLIFERHIYNLTQSELLNEMNNYSFFLALPGRGMPLCHNLIEAMYCRSIPILQDIYAKMMPKPLEDGINCLVYKSLEDIDNLTQRIHELDKKTIEKLSKNVELYYKDYLSPSAVVKSILESNLEKFYLQAEGYSIKLYESTNHSV